MEGLQSVLNMAVHSYLVVEGSADYALSVYDVGYPGGAQAKSSPHIVKAANFPGCVAPESERNSGAFSEVLHPFHAVGTYSDDYRITRQQLIMGFTETPDLD